MMSNILIVIIIYTGFVILAFWHDKSHRPFRETILDVITVGITIFLIILNADIKYYVLLIIIYGGLHLLWLKKKDSYWIKIIEELKKYKK